MCGHVGVIREARIVRSRIILFASTVASMRSRAPDHERLTMIEAWLDPVTIRHPTARGVTNGWRCLEVGAGGGPIAAWLGAQVGAAGHVLAIDIDIRLLDAIDIPNLTSGSPTPPLNPLRALSPRRRDGVGRWSYDDNAR